MKIRIPVTTSQNYSRGNHHETHPPAVADMFFSLAQAQEPSTTGGSTADLQKATQNPVASLISVPLQNNSNFGIGPYDRTQNVLNIQPVVPMKATDKMNLII